MKEYKISPTQKFWFAGLIAIAISDILILAVRKICGFEVGGVIAFVAFFLIGPYLMIKYRQKRQPDRRNLQWVGAGIELAAFASFVDIYLQTSDFWWMSSTWLGIFAFTGFAYLWISMDQAQYGPEAEKPQNPVTPEARRTSSDGVVA